MRTLLLILLLSLSVAACAGGTSPRIEPPRFHDDLDPR
jgi:hypothetical protein